MVFGSEITEDQARIVLAALFRLKFPPPHLVLSPKTTDATASLSNELIPAKLREGYKTLLAAASAQGKGKAPASVQAVVAVPDKHPKGLKANPGPAPNSAPNSLLDKQLLPEICLWVAKPFVKSTVKTCAQLRRHISKYSGLEKHVRPEHEAKVLVVLAFMLRHWAVWCLLFEVSTLRARLQNQSNNQQASTTFSPLQFYDDSDAKGYLTAGKIKKASPELLGLEFTTLQRCMSFLLNDAASKPSLNDFLKSCMTEAGKKASTIEVRERMGYIRVSEMFSLHEKVTKEEQQKTTTVKPGNKPILDPKDRVLEIGAMKNRDRKKKGETVTTRQPLDENGENGVEEGMNDLFGAEEALEAEDNSASNKMATTKAQRRRVVDTNEFNPWLPHPELLPGQGTVFAVPYVPKRMQDFNLAAMVGEYQKQGEEKSDRGKRNREDDSSDEDLDEHEKLLRQLPKHQRRDIRRKCRNYCSRCRGVLKSASIGDEAGPESAYTGSDVAYQCASCWKVYHVRCMGLLSPREEFFEPFVCMRCQLERIPTTPSVLDSHFRIPNEEDDCSVEFADEMNFLLTHPNDRPTPFLAYAQKWRTPQ